MGTEKPDVIDVHIHAMYIQGFDMPLPPGIRSHATYEEVRDTAFRNPLFSFFSVRFSGSWGVVLEPASRDR